MESWILFALLAYFFLALVNVADKFLLGKFLPSYKAYAFLVSTLAMLAFLLAPWFLEWPGWNLFFWNLVIGAFFPLSLLVFYKALKDGEASQVVTLIGGLIPIFTILFSILFLGETFTSRQWMAIFLLLLGTLIIAWFPEEHDAWSKVRAWFKHEAQRNYWYGLGIGVLAALLFSIFMTGTKYLYLKQEFFSAFIWMRLGGWLFVWSLFLSAKNRKEILHSFHKIKKGSGKWVFLGIQSMGAVGAFLQNLAISLGPVALITALQGVQYAFLLLLGVVFTIFMPKAFHERISLPIIIQKIIAVLLIGGGLYFIAI